MEIIKKEINGKLHIKIVRTNEELEKIKIEREQRSNKNRNKRK